MSTSTSTTRWIATYDTITGELCILSSDTSTPVRAWSRRPDLFAAIQTVILWGWENPTEAWRTGPLWIGIGDFYVTEVEPIRITVEAR
ncbi:hypothetical protein ABT354_11115 [Streptomyces sp. NPDC000594]|uniref:hypothetical protein n=1 Tax=Streptomyces sp. NPDC000594 TaxID=3154261 RepID=UPI00332CEAE2